MTAPNCNYTTTEKELLSIVENLKEFCNILLGHQITVYTDHLFEVGSHGVLYRHTVRYCTGAYCTHNDASKLKLGAVVSQKGEPIAFYSRNMNSAQQNYTTTEKELLSIVETLKEFCNILLGHHITVYTDHKNLTYKHFNTERVMRWRLILEEFGPELKYIKGENNVVVDALSRLEKSPNQEILNISELYLPQIR